MTIEETAFQAIQAGLINEGKKWNAIKGHFKKHWGKYATGAAILGSAAAAKSGIDDLRGKSGHYLHNVYGDHVKHQAEKIMGGAGGAIAGAGGAAGYGLVKFLGRKKKKD